MAKKRKITTQNGIYLRELVVDSDPLSAEDVTNFGLPSAIPDDHVFPDPDLAIEEVYGHDGINDENYSILD